MLSEDNQIWQATPLLCFQNDLSLELALSVGFNLKKYLGVKISLILYKILHIGIEWHICKAK